MSALPSSIRIGFAVFAVEPINDLPKKVLGDIEPDHARIRIDVDRPDQMIAATLLHEVLHGCWYMANLPEQADEEDVVTSVANQLSQVWRDNPELITYLSTALGQP